MAQAQSIYQDKKHLVAACSQSQQARRRLAFAFGVAGAISFWMPDVIVHAEAGPNLAARHAWVITVLAPATFLFVYLVARRFALKHHFDRVGPMMLLGVWVSGGLFMTAAAILSGSEFIGGTGLWRLVPIVISVIPIVTYILAAYDGSLFALLAITLGGLLILGFRSSVALWRSAEKARNAADETSVAQSDESKAA